MISARAILDSAVSEREFQDMIAAYGRLQGWELQYHTFDSRRSARGFPDLVLVRPPRLVFAELKSERGKLTSWQETWLLGLRMAGAEAYCWRPSDWPDIERLLSKLAPIGAGEPEELEGANGV